MGKPKKKLSAYNLYMRRALKGKLTGKTEAQRKAIFKAAARGWKKGKPKSTSRSSKPKSRASPKKKANPTGGTRQMAKFNTRKIFSVARMISLVGPAAITIMDSRYTPQRKGEILMAKYTGVSPDGTFRLADLRQGYEPYFWTSLATYGIPKIVSFLKGLLG